MRAPIWHDKWLNPLRKGAMLDFAIIWDEDHDDRLLPVIEEIYFAGLLAPVRFIGERKGTLSVLIDVETVQTWKPAALRTYREAISGISNGQNDPWVAYVGSLNQGSSPANRDRLLASRDPSIIHEDSTKVATYLQYIDMLWNIGIKPHEIQAVYVGEEEPEPTVYKPYKQERGPDPEIPF
jgi:hypothetical protein